MALPPPGTLADVTGVTAVAVQPDGTVADRVTPETGVLPPLVNVALAVDGWPAGMTAGVEFVSVPWTTMTAVPVTPLTVHPDRRDAVLDRPHQAARRPRSRRTGRCWSS